MSKRTQTLSQDDTIGLLLTRSQRPDKTVPIRKTFVQQGTQRKPQPGPLADFVRRADERGLDLFLLSRAVTSGGDHSVTEWSSTWGRALGIHDQHSASTAISRIWRRLEDARLIKRTRGKQRKARIQVLMEDGSGRDYIHPGDRAGARERYFKLPYEYWSDEQRWYRALSLPAKAMLLVALSRNSDAFILPEDQVPDWYGLSSDTASRGLAELQERGLLAVRRKKLQPTLKSRTGYMQLPIYCLESPFDIGRRGQVPRNEQVLP